MQKHWVVTCKDYGLPQRWEFPPTDEGLAQAQAFVGHHHALQGHQAQIHGEITATLQGVDDDTPGWYMVGNVPDMNSIRIERRQEPTVIAGRPSVFYMAYCTDCAGMRVPFGAEEDRDAWEAAHHDGTGHTVTVGIEIRPEETP